MQACAGAGGTGRVPGECISRTDDNAAPSPAAPTIKAHCAQAPVKTSASPVTPSASARRCPSGQSVRAMPQTAWATTATAASFNPCSAPSTAG